MNEFSETERFSTNANAGFEGFEAVREGRVGIEDRRGEDQFGGVTGNLEKLVDAVTLSEIGFDVVQ